MSYMSEHELHLSMRCESTAPTSLERDFDNDLGPASLATWPVRQ